MHRAAREGIEDVIRFWVNAGADVNAKNEIKETALFGAAKGGHFKVVDFLLEKGIDANAKNKYG